jgi:hypothetical protein
MKSSQNTARLHRFTALTLVALSSSEIAFQFFGSSTAQLASRFAFLILCACLIPYFKLRDWALAIFAALLIFGLCRREGGIPDILFALDRAAFFAAFIYLVTLLKEAAERSPSVLDLGIYLTNQPPGRRYYALAFGGHATGILLNFGAISLLSPLVQRGARSKGTETPELKRAAEVLEQQQISAIIRGFTWMVMWSPASLAQVVLFTTVPDADMRITIPLGIAATIVMILVGRFEDRLRWRKKPADTSEEKPDFPYKAAVRFSVICSILIGATLIVAWISSVSLVLALMFVAPLLVAAWFFEHNYTGSLLQSVKATAASFTKMLCQSSIISGHSAITLGIAGFIGVAASKIAPVEVFSAKLEAVGMPDWLLLISLPIIILLCGQIALSPILVVVFMGSVLSEFQTPAADPNLVFFALGSGWALSMVASPNASATLLLSGICGVPPTTLTWRWNGVYAVLCTGVFAVSFYVLTIF